MKTQKSSKKSSSKKTITVHSVTFGGVHENVVPACEKLHKTVAKELATKREKQTNKPKTRKTPA